MATHSSILAWRIPWMEEPVGLQSMGSKRVRHDWATVLIWSDTILFSTASDFTSITSQIHRWALFTLCLSLFILPGAIFPLFSSSVLSIYWPEEFIFQCHIFLPFHTLNGILKTRILKWFAIRSPVNHVLSELSTMTHLSWVALHGMAQRFIELDKAVIQVITLVSFL